MAAEAIMHTNKLRNFRKKSLLFLYGWPQLEPSSSLYKTIVLSRINRCLGRSITHLVHRWLCPLACPG
jgi:hypothetical protein